MVSIYANEETIEHMEDSLLCPVCIESYHMELETFLRAKAARARNPNVENHAPLLAADSRLPVSCPSCSYTFCNACLHRHTFRPGGMKCPVCFRTDMSVAAPPVNQPLVQAFRLIQPIVSAPRTALIEDFEQLEDFQDLEQLEEPPSLAHAVPVVRAVQVVTPDTKRTAAKAKKSVKKPAVKTKKYVGTFTIQAIVGRRVSNGKKHYRVRWEGYGEADDTWEPWSNLKHLDGVLIHQIQALDEQAIRSGSGVVHSVNV